MERSDATRAFRRRTLGKLVVSLRVLRSAADEALASTLTGPGASD
jgi:hypothetical protein